MKTTWDWEDWDVFFIRSDSTTLTRDMEMSHFSAAACYHGALILLLLDKMEHLLPHDFFHSFGHVTMKTNG